VPFIFSISSPKISPYVPFQTRRRLTHNSPQAWSHCSGFWDTPTSHCFLFPPTSNRRPSGCFFSQWPGVLFSFSLCLVVRPVTVPCSNPFHTPCFEFSRTICRFPSMCGINCVLFDFFSNRPTPFALCRCFDNAPQTVPHECHCFPYTSSALPEPKMFFFATPFWQLFHPYRSPLVLVQSSLNFFFPHALLAIRTQLSPHSRPMPVFLFCGEFNLGFSGVPMHFHFAKPPIDAVFLSAQFLCGKFSPCFLS